MRVERSLLAAGVRGCFPSPIRVAIGLVALGAGCSSAPLDTNEQEPADTPKAPALGTSGDYFAENYPPGPYGTRVGSVIENLAFLGWRDPARVNYDVEKLETVRLSDFYDPEGERGVRYLWINASAVWCGVCRAEMQDIRAQNIYSELGARGLQLVGTLFEDNDSRPARPSDLKLWGSLPEHSIEFPLLLDPGFKLGAFFTSDATPLNLMIDARTMKVLDANMGYSSTYWAQVEKLLDR
jgi:hypothetical protein